MTTFLSKLKEEPHDPKVPFHSFRSVGNMDMLDMKEETDNLPRNHESILGPSNPDIRKQFFLSVAVLVIAGAANDFLGKTIYQILPGTDSGWDGFVNDHWVTLSLATCAFISSSMAIFFGRESFKDLTLRAFIKMLMPSLMDFLVTMSRYLALVFLPAAMVTILKSGLQLVFLSIVRWWRGKILGTYQWIGLFVLVIGLSVVSLHTFLANALTKTNFTVLDDIIGVTIMLFVGVFGAIRNTFEEILLKDEYTFNPFFIVGIESLVSLILAIFVGIIAFIIEGITIIDISNAISTKFREYPSIIICLCFFMTVVFLKDTMQMKVTRMSSAMTRKLFQQLYPLFTFSFGLILWLITKTYGAQPDKFTYIELIGFCIVLYGAYLYFLEPKYGMPQWLRTLIGISDADNTRRSTDFEADRKQSLLLDNDFLNSNGIDTQQISRSNSNSKSYSNSQDAQIAMTKV